MLWLCGCAAWGQTATTQDIAAECERQMQAGVCLSRPDRTHIPPGQTMLISGAGRVSFAAYADYMDLYDPKNPNDAAMCKLALRYLNTEPQGDHAKIARALWTPPTPLEAGPLGHGPTAATSAAAIASVPARLPQREANVVLTFGKIVLLVGVAYFAFRASRRP